MTFRNALMLLLMMVFAPSALRAQDDGLAGKLALKPAQYADDEAANRTADELEQQFPSDQRPEAVRMMLDILRSADIGPRAAWFGPAQTRFDWKWLATQQGLGQDVDELPVASFRGGEVLGNALDRDGDGSIGSADLDWSDSNPWVQQAYLVGRLFRRIDAAGDGRLTREEWSSFFDRVSGGSDHLLIADLQDALLRGGGGKGDAPSREVLVRGLIAGEVGSMHEGPQLGDAAPGFKLKSPDGAQTYELARLVGPKPVVLVFGNFTCGPFRSMYPDVETLYQLYRDQATFLMVYVREAHPTDGWAMEANARAKVAVKQPTTLGERAAVCTEFCQRLKPTMPVVVDDVNDAVGHAYSGMPARLYLIDRAGKVAYKSGRGPFGFKVGELEQALAMALLEARGPVTNP
jgi:hypothetical protein